MLIYTPLLDINLHKKPITESQNGHNFVSAHMLFVIYTFVTTLHFCDMKNALVFSK